MKRKNPFSDFRLPREAWVALIDNWVYSSNGERDRNITKDAYINEMMMYEIADKYNLSQRQVSNILDRSFVKLRNGIESERTK